MEKQLPISMDHKLFETMVESRHFFSFAISVVDRPLVKSAYQKFIFLFLKQNI